MRLFLDTETYSETPIDYGTHQYADAGRGAEIMLLAYAFDDEPAAVVDFCAHEELPQRVLDAFADPSVELWAHNSHFDRTVMKRFWPEVADPARWRDTMILAYAHSLPGSLATLCEIFGLPSDQAKDADGRRLVHLFCKPQPAGRKIRRATELTHPEDWGRFVNYCRLDVEAMREVWRRMPKWNDTPQLWRDWVLDQRINDRGMAIDVPLVRAAIAAAGEAKEASDREAFRMTAGAVESTGQRDAMLKHILETYGVKLPDLKTSTLERRLEDEDLPPPVRELIALRMQSAKTSVTKFTTLGNAVSADGRLRGCLQFMGAARTGRWTGKLFQPQNLPRGTMKPYAVERGIAALKAGVADLLYDDIPSLVSNCLRGAIIAPSGRKLVVADLSNIEGRMLAWLAGEEWKLEAFRAYDRGEGPDLYKATYGRTFGVDPAAVTKQQRQIGKVLELAMGYQGGVGAFLTFATAYRVDLDELAAHTRQAIDPRFWQEAADGYEWFAKKGLTHGLAKETFIACEAIKRAWRAAHPAIVKFWGDVDAACRKMLDPRSAHAVRVGKLWIGRRADRYGAVMLPSGRSLIYPGLRAPTESERATFVYRGVNQYSRKWSDIRTYAGKVVENATQSAARDVLASSMPAIEADGYQIVLSVHDELITEAPDSPEFSTAKLAGFMSTPPAWAPDLPLAAAGFEAYRYKKE